MEPRGAVFVVVPEARPVTHCTPALVEGREATMGQRPGMSPEHSLRMRALDQPFAEASQTTRRLLQNHREKHAEREGRPRH